MTAAPDGGSTSGGAADRYAALYNAREQYCIRARDAASLTMPYVMPPLGFNYTMSLPTPYQSLGARGVRNLASKLLLALFPSNTLFFKYEIDDFLLAKLAKTPDARGEFEKAMNRRERAIMTEFDKDLFRVPAFASLVHLIITGNYLIHVPEKGRARGFRLDQFVVRRSPDGELLEIIVQEKINPRTLPKNQRAAIVTDHEPAQLTLPDMETDVADPHKGSGEKDVDLYTRVLREDDGDWTVYQECQGEILPDSVGKYSKDQPLPWLPLRMSTQPGEDYGRGYVEELLGDLDALEALSQTLVEGIAAAARVVFLVKPGGVTRAKVIAKARNGDVQIGNAEDVTVVEAANKAADFQTAQKQAEEIGSRLSYAFMLNSSVQRTGDRVTAEEIRYMAGELDDALGGIYTLLAAEYQLPVVLIFERRMQKRRNVPPLPKDVANPVITTGLEAIGRGTDLANMKAFLSDVIQVLTPQIAMRYINGTDFIDRAAASYGIDTDGLIKTDDEVQAEMQAEQQQSMMQNLAPHAAKAVGDIAKTAVKGHYDQQAAAQQQQGQQGQ